MYEFMPNDPKKSLLYLLKTKGELTLEQTQESLNLAKTTIRQHLKALEDRGLVERQYQTLGQGRPTVLFLLTPKGKEIFPNKESLLLKELLQFIQQTNQFELLSQFLKNYWQKRKKDFNNILKSLSKNKNPSFEIRVKALHQLLEVEGFMPTEGNNIDEIIRECNCPFRSCITVTQLPCLFESQFISEVLEVNVKRTQYIPSGEYACTYSYNKKKDHPA